MTFLEHMEDLENRVEDFSGAAVAAVDGIIVEEYKKDPSIDMGLLVAEYGALWNSIDSIALGCEMGASQEINVFTDGGILVVRKISSGFFLLFGLSSERSFGKGRFYARIIAEDLVKELSL